MHKEMKRKERTILAFILLVVLVVAIGGVSYAAFQYSKTGEKVNTITTGQIVMRYTETDNVININNALPISDEVGMAQLRTGEYFDFNISSTIVGNTNINYEISAKDVTDSNARKIDGKYIKLYLTKLNGDSEEPLMTPTTYNEETIANSYTGRPAGEMSLYEGSMSASEDNDYRLRMWVSDEYNPQGDGGGLTFSVQINVYGLDGLSKEDRMMRTAGSEDFHSSTYRSSVTSIVTKGNTNIPEGVIESWDISEKQNGSVIAYVEDDGTGSGTYKVTIGANGRIVANYNMSSYFLNFSNLTSIDLSYLDTSLVTDMSMMFCGSTNLTTLDLSSFDTANVTTMHYMFCNNIIFGTPMNLTKITFGEEFNTSKVISMTGMFGGCTKLTELDLSFFNTTNVTNMAQMFAHCNSLSTLNLSNFNTLKVTDISSMFQNCYALTELDLTSFDTSNVTNYSNMFSNANSSSLSSIFVTEGQWTIPNTVITNAIALSLIHI